jgi:hypothetical protein
LLRRVANRWRLNRSATVKVVLVPLIGQPILPVKFRKPSDEPRAGLFHGCSHGADPRLRKFRDAASRSLDRDVAEMSNVTISLKKAQVIANPY